MTKDNLQSPLASVIVAMGVGSQGVADCLDALAAQTKPPLEVLLIGYDAGRVARRGLGRWTVQTIEADRGALVPELWALGIQRARGAILALTAVPCRPEAAWLECILEAFEAHPECAVVGGAIDPPRSVSASDWAAYFARYNAFLPPVVDGFATDLPGENVAYRRDALAAAWSRPEKGFWETEVHGRMHALGLALYHSSEIRVRFGPVGPPWRFASARRRHGRHYGAMRVGSRAVQLARAATVPALPFVLMSRILRRAVRRRRSWSGCSFRALPWLFVFLCGWSFGEAQGYLRGRP